MIKTIIAILLVLWLVGLLAKIGGAFVHLLLLVAVVIFVYNILVSRRRTS